jgi:hypothetical protein
LRCWTAAVERIAGRTPRCSGRRCSSTKSGTRRGSVGSPAAHCGAPLDRKRSPPVRGAVGGLLGGDPGRAVRQISHDDRRRVPGNVGTVADPQTGAILGRRCPTRRSLSALADAVTAVQATTVAAAARRCHRLAGAWPSFRGHRGCDLPGRVRHAGTSPRCASRALSLTASGVRTLAAEG